MLVLRIFKAVRTRVWSALNVIEAIAKRSEYAPALTMAISKTSKAHKPSGIEAGSKCIAMPAHNAPMVMHPSSDKAIVPLFSENMPPSAVTVRTHTKAKRKKARGKRRLLTPVFQNSYNHYTHSRTRLKQLGDYSQTRKYIFQNSLNRYENKVLNE